MPMLPITFQLGEPTIPDVPRVGYRARYPWQGGNNVPANMPAVMPALRWQNSGYVKYVQPIQFTQPMQWLTWWLMKRLNETISMKQWGAVYAGDRWGTNGNGWDNKKEPDDQRRDYVQDRYAGYQDPKLMDAIIFSGSAYAGEEDEHHVIMRPGVHGIDVYKPLPDVDEVLENGWYFYAVNNTNPPTNFPQGNGGVVAIPYFLREAATYPKAWFVKEVL